ncbi:MAG: F0F1 ATP synthase subunit delta [Candidatus Curtissbacteria bacterium]|nr:F0F1 ATP synthase subunit delta [Candidatus Curtissbacteria bacterium]
MNDTVKLDSMNTKQEVEDFMRVLSDQGTSRSKTSERLSELKKYLAGRTIVSLTLGFEPDEKFMSEVKKWLDREMGENILIDLSVNRKIIGGVQIIANDHFRDFSLSSRLTTEVLGRNVTN